MIHAEPLGRQLDESHFQAAYHLMRCAGVHLLYVDRAWATLREYSELDWHSVLQDLRYDSRTQHWFR